MRRIHAQEAVERIDYIVRRDFFHHIKQGRLSEETVDALHQRITLSTQPNISRTLRNARNTVERGEFFEGFLFARNEDERKTQIHRLTYQNGNSLIAKTLPPERCGDFDVSRVTVGVPTDDFTELVYVRTALLIEPI